MIVPLDCVSFSAPSADVSHDVKFRCSSPTPPSTPGESCTVAKRAILTPKCPNTLLCHSELQTSLDELIEKLQLHDSTCSSVHEEAHTKTEIESLCMRIDVLVAILKEEPAQSGAHQSELKSLRRKINQLSALLPTPNSSSHESTVTCPDELSQEEPIIDCPTVARTGYVHRVVLTPRLVKCVVPQTPQCPRELLFANSSPSRKGLSPLRAGELEQTTRRHLFPIF